MEKKKKKEGRKGGRKRMRSKNKKITMDFKKIQIHTDTNIYT
jgi:hypothetical protein